MPYAYYLFGTEYGHFTYPIALKFTESGAPMSYRAIVIACLATVSPEEHSLIIRDVPPDEQTRSG